MTDKETNKRPKTLAEKLAAATKDIGPIAKSGKNITQHYDFQQESDIKAAVRRVETKYSFTIIPKFEILKHYERTTRKGSVMTFYDVMGHFTITDGYETLEGTMPGSGSDTGDKAVQKACTSAQKYFYKQVFNITDTDDDPDTTDSYPEGGYVASNEQQPTRKPAPAKKATKADYGKAALGAKTTINGQPVLIVQLVAEAFNAGNAASKKALESLTGADRKMAGYIYKNKLYKNWPN